MAHVLHHQFAVATPRIRRVEASRPLAWLRQGWHDVSRLRGISFAYGALIAGFGVMLLALAWNVSYLVPVFVGGFLLVAPFAAIGLYALAQQLEAGGTVSAERAWFAWRRNAGSIALFGLMLALALILWERTAAIVFALSYGGTVPDLANLMSDLLFSGRYLPLLLSFMGAGALYALVVFALSVVTAPMLLDRPVDVITAAVTSLRACLHNPGAALVWAALLAGLTALGFVTAMIGLVVLFPWLGYASWHAYRDLVE